MAYVEIKVPGGPDAKKLKKGIDLILRMLEEQMSVMSDFFMNAQASLQRIEVAQEDQSQDIAALKAEVVRLQAGGVTPQDQEALSALAARLDAAAVKAEANAAMTPPAPQVV